MDIASACERWLSARGFSGEAHDDDPDAAVWRSGDCPRPAVCRLRGVRTGREDTLRTCRSLRAIEAASSGCAATSCARRSRWVVWRSFRTAAWCWGSSGRGQAGPLGSSSPRRSSLRSSRRSSRRRARRAQAGGGGGQAGDDGAGRGASVLGRAAQAGVRGERLGVSALQQADEAAVDRDPRAGDDAGGERVAAGDGAACGGVGGEVRGA